MIVRGAMLLAAPTLPSLPVPAEGSDQPGNVDPRSEPEAVREPQVDDNAEAAPCVGNDAVALCHTMTSLVDNPAFASSTAGSSEAAAANRELLRVAHSSDTPRCDAERVSRSR